MSIPFFKTPVLQVSQPMGVFYVGVIPAKILLKVCESDFLRATLSEDENSYKLKGTQRETRDSRLLEIAEYINRHDSIFPNSIIIAASQDEDMLIKKGKEQTSNDWFISSDGDNEWLNMPTSKQKASVIDGQHRLFAFGHPKTNAKAKDMSLLCSVFLNLHKSLQAQIFATINSTQKRVNRSLTYELFGYNTEDEDEAYWPPDKLSVFLTRRLGVMDESPLKQRIQIRPKLDKSLNKFVKNDEWKVSTAAVAAGILRLITSNPKKDMNYLRESEKKTRIELDGVRNDRSPLRPYYFKGQDNFIYNVVLNYLKACDQIFWANANKKLIEESFIFRTIGVQAILDILRLILPNALEDKDVTEDYFLRKLEGAKGGDFTEDRFKNASGSGRIIIRKEIERLINNGKTFNEG